MLRPKAIRLEASSFCQLRCPSCPTTKGDLHPHVGSGFLRFADFKNIVDSNPSISRIELSNYGEIFLNPDLYWILRFAHSRDVMITAENGVNLNNARDDVLEALVRYRVDRMTCSIDGASQETYSKYRVRGNYFQVIRNIRKINEFKKQYRSSLPRLKWQFVVFGHNEHEIDAARNLAAELDMEFAPKLSWDEEFSPIRNPDAVREALGMKAVTRTEFTEDTGVDYIMNQVCWQLWDLPQINWDGKVLGCCINHWGEFGGNAFADGLYKVLNSENMKHARDMLQGKAPEKEGVPCSTCFVYQRAKKSGKWLVRDAKRAGAVPAVAEQMRISA